MREIATNICGAVLVLCLMVIPATALAALLGSAFGSVAGPDGQFWGAVILGSFAFLTVSSILGLEVLGS